MLFDCHVHLIHVHVASMTITMHCLGNRARVQPAHYGYRYMYMYNVCVSSMSNLQGWMTADTGLTSNQGLQMFFSSSLGMKEIWTGLRPVLVTTNLCSCGIMNRTFRNWNCVREGGRDWFIILLQEVIIQSSLVVPTSVLLRSTWGSVSFSSLSSLQVISSSTSFSFFASTTRT